MNICYFALKVQASAFGGQTGAQYFVNLRCDIVLMLYLPLTVDAA